MHWTINIESGELNGVSGYRHYLVVQPEARRVYLFTTIDSGTPVDVWHRRAETIGLPVGVDGNSVTAVLEAHTDELDTIAAAYLGEKWNGNNHVGKWAEGDQDEAKTRAIQTIEQELSALPTYWDAREWLYPSRVDAVRACGASLAYGFSIEQWAEDDCERHASDALVDADDLCAALLDYVRDDTSLLLDRGALIPGAAELAKLAGVELPGDAEADSEARNG